MPRDSYHHGDLRNALIRTGLEVTRSGGPDALAVRDAARRLDVSPNAAYRHFSDRDALLAAVTERIQADMAERIHAFEAEGRGADDPRQRLRAVGLGYIAFALDEPGWFQVAFGRIDTRPGPASEGGMPPPLALLVAALDGLAAAGLLAPEARAGAEWPCWSAVHGFASLALTGPLRGMPRPEVWAHAERTVDAVIDGVLADPAAAGGASVIPAAHAG